MIPASRVYFKNKLKVNDKNLIDSVFSEANVKDVKGTVRKKNKFENVNSSIKSIQEKLKTFANIDSDPSVKKNIEFFLNYIDSMNKEADNLKQAIEELKTYYKREGGI